MKKRKIFKILSPLLTFFALFCAFYIPSTVASFIDYLTVDTNQESFIDDTTKNFICYPLVKENQNDPNAVAIGWAKTPEECTGALTIPDIVTKLDGNVSTQYTVKAIAECGFRFCNFSSITFAGNNVEEIKSEAFYSCQNFTTFTMPQKCIHGVGPSSFMDCRKLEKVDMTNLNNNLKSTLSALADDSERETYISNHNYVIGDYAFASCVKLKGFVFPTNLYEIGESAFNNCGSIFGLFFPSKNYGNSFEIKQYAFSDCSNLAVVHFEKNVTNIGLYCFAKCEKLKIYYEGNINDSSDPLYKSSLTIDKNWRKRHVATNQNGDNFDADGNGTGPDYVPIKNNISAMQMDDEHPGLIYIKQSASIIYDGKSDSTKVLDANTNQGDYITIFQWNTPTVPSNDYDATTKVLTIPETIDGAPVKVIAEQAFYRERETNEKLKGVIFPSNLVQICHDAFLANNELETIDFSRCTKLQEIGHSAFDPNGTNNKFTGTLTLPNSLKFIGNSAFVNFKKATSLELFTNPSTKQLKIIGHNAFSYFGYNASSAYKGTLDLVLPNTLMDGAVSEYQPTSMATGVYGCVGSSAFANCPLLRTVEMESVANPPKTVSNSNNRTSFFGSCFSNCENLIRFKANKKMSRLGENLFGMCPKLKEIFLSTYLASSDTDNMIWGYGEGQSIFYTHDKDANACEFKDLVIYVDGGDAPVRKAKQQKYYIWNTDPKTYSNEYARSLDQENIWGHYHNEGSANNSGRFINDTVIGRLVVPTYFNVDYENGAVKYINTTDGTVSTSPSSDYSNCAAAIKKDGANNSTSYIVTKCYAYGQTSLDLTTWNLDANITSIGSCAFSTLTSGNVAQKIILPSSLTMIRDRAFYSDIHNGITTVTYKNNGTEVTDTGANSTTKICFLPSGVTRIEEFAFFNNNFEKVLIPSTLVTMGNTAFAVSIGKQASIVSFKGSGASSSFTYVDDGMYDTSTNTLLYYGAGGTGTLDLSGNTINAIGARALANTKYTSMVLPSSVTTIYGGAFEGNENLEEVSGLSGLKYIATIPAKGSGETDIDVWNDDANFTIYDLPPKDFCKVYEYDPATGTGSGNTGLSGVGKGNFANRPYFYRWIDSYGAFAKCSNLTTLNLTACKSSLRKIGYGAFEGCSSLSTMTDGSTTYTYYRYSDYTGLTQDNFATLTSAQNAVVDQTTTGVCDLSEAVNLTSIGRLAFNGCSSLKYFHLPILASLDTAKSQAGQAKFTLGLDYDDIGSWYNYASNSVSGISASANNKGVFYETGAATDGAVLVGETVNYARSGGSKYYDFTKYQYDADVKPDNFADAYDKTLYKVTRYQPSALTGVNAYYYVRTDDNNTIKGDLLSSQLNSNVYKYWIDLGNHTYLLFDKGSQVKAFFGIN